LDKVFKRVERIYPEANVMFECFETPLLTK